MSTKENTAPTKKRLWSANSQRIMLIVIIVCVVICAALFSFLGVHMTNTSNNALDLIGGNTMKETNYQFSKRFEAIMEQRLQMVEALIKDYSPNDPEYRKALEASAKNRGFSNLAFVRITATGENDPLISDPKKGREIDCIYGNFVSTDPKSFRLSILSRESKVAVGTELHTDNTAGEDLVLFSVPTDLYEMPSGEKSMALIAGVSNSDFVKMLNLENDASYQNVDAYIIRKDASFVLNGDVDASSYKDFDSLLTQKFPSDDIKTVLQELSDKMNNNSKTNDNDSKQTNAVYSKILHVNDKHIYMYCNKLELSEWYLVSLTDNSDLNSVIGQLNNQWATMIIIAVVAIFLILIAIFVLYNHFNRRTLRQLEHARAEALDASKAKSEFLSNMSHDIRTPMNAIVGMTAIARSNIDNPQQVKDCLKKIAISSKHLLGLINDVLDMSKIESGKMTLNMEQISLREVLDGITTIVQPQVKIKRQHFNVIIHNVQQENVYCDSVRLNQVLLNLLSNAIKFTGEEGTIEVHFEQESSPIGDDFIRTRIRVKDNGIGMSPEYQKKVFESFSREDTKRVHRTEGTGLGMSITKYIVDAMKGTIELHSEQGVGTEFRITLDLEKAIIPEEEMILPNWKMLIVDDDEQLCESTVASLKEIGIDAKWTLDGESAIEKTVQAHKARNGFDIILMDWKLPGIDGIEAAKQIRKKLGDDGTPILLISAYDWSEIEEEAKAAGICGFISKPLFKSTLFYGLKQFADGTEATHSENKTPVKKVNLEGTHVLLAEDNDLNWEIAEALLESVGITCDHAENGQICVDMLNNSKQGTYAAILMDIRMPVMNGYEATAEIRKLNHPDKDLPIIAMTADAFADDMKKCLECGMNAHIAKPIDIEIVQNTLAKYIKK